MTKLPRKCESIQGKDDLCKMLQREAAIYANCQVIIISRRNLCWNRRRRQLAEQWSMSLASTAFAKTLADSFLGFCSDYRLKTDAGLLFGEWYSHHGPCFVAYVLVFYSRPLCTQSLRKDWVGFMRCDLSCTLARLLLC